MAALELSVAVINEVLYVDAVLALCEVLQSACLYVCVLFVCLSVCPLTYLTRPNFRKFYLRVTCDRGSILL